MKEGKICNTNSFAWRLEGIFGMCGGVGEEGDIADICRKRKAMD